MGGGRRQKGGGGRGGKGLKEGRGGSERQKLHQVSVTIPSTPLRCPSCRFDLRVFTSCPTATLKN